MQTLKPSELKPLLANNLRGTELVTIADTSNVSETAGTISAAASDNSINDSAGNLPAVKPGAWVQISGFTDSAGELNAQHVCVSSTASKLVVETDITADEAAGASVTVEELPHSYTTTLDELASLFGGGGGGGGGLFESYALLADQKPSGTDAGTFTAADWRTRDINTELADSASIVSVASNQFTLNPGDYLIKWVAPAYRVERHQSRLYNVTDSAVEGYGSSGYARNTSDSTDTFSFGSLRVSIASAKTFEIQHRSTGTRSPNGFGLNSANAEIEQYLMVEIYKEA
ncbi:hypothetical protein [Neptuniibacter sp.]|uniref:hypothetical protein n=1 Tax=Neptuniibacter sp. TaxID=1962643 RepID=UPI003B5C9372